MRAQINSTHSKSKPDFTVIAQRLAEKYYWKPYPKAATTGRIRRALHGATHAACATLTADHIDVIQGKIPYCRGPNEYNGGIFIELLKKYLPDQYAQILQTLNNNKPLDEVDFLLLKCAIFCHDIANTSDGPFHDEMAHANIFTKEMLALGFPPQKVAIFSKAIAEKEASGPKNIWQMLIHDADCWEITRVFADPYRFQIDRLDLVTLLKEKIQNTALLKHALCEISTISRFYYRLMHHLYGDDRLHERIELSTNIYRTVVNEMQRLSKIEKIKSLSTNVSPHLRAITSEQLNVESKPLNLYSSTLSDEMIDNICKILLPYYAGQTGEDAAIECFKHQGLYLRVILNKSLADEILTLNGNIQLLQSHGIRNPAQLKSYFTNKTPSTAAPLLPGFFFRPSTLIKEGLAMRFLCNNNAVLINPQHPDVLAVYFYKRNINSNYIGVGNFFFQRPEPARAKDKASHANLVNKLLEREERRQGYRFDNYNRNYGNVSNEHDEVLLSYTPDSIAGIVVTPDTIASALNMKLELEKINKKPVNFYFYRESGQLTLLQDKTVISWLINPWRATEYLQANRALQLEKNGVSPESEITDTYRELKIEELDITCSLEEFPPSAEHPIRYSVKHKTQPVFGSFYMLNGAPIAELNGTRIAGGLSLLRRIVETYQTYTILNCEALFKKPGILSQIALANIKLQMLGLGVADKPYLLWSFNKRSAMNLEKILESIGYPHRQCKWELLSEKKGETEVKLCVPQALSFMWKKLQSYDVAVQQRKQSAPMHRTAAFR